MYQVKAQRPPRMLPISNPHCKYIDRKYYDILSCLIYHSNFVVFSTADGGVQPMAAAVFDYSHS